MEEWPFQEHAVLISKTSRIIFKEDLQEEPWNWPGISETLSQCPRTTAQRQDQLAQDSSIIVFIRRQEEILIKPPSNVHCFHWMSGRPRVSFWAWIKVPHVKKQNNANQCAPNKQKMLVEPKKKKKKNLNSQKAKKFKLLIRKMGNLKHPLLNIFPKSYA